MNYGKVLVVDDDAEQGEMIVRHLWGYGIPVVFIHYDPKLIEEGMFPGGHLGVRVIVMDIDLLGGGKGDSLAWGVVQAEIERLLHQNNGPWRLVTWTSHAYRSAGLFEQLKERLPAGIRPVDLVVLDKEPVFSAKASDGESDLASAVSDGINVTGPLACLGEWEATTRKAASKIVHSMSATANEIEGNDCCNLKQLLFELAKAEAGHGNVRGAQDVPVPVSRILTALLADELEQSQPDSQNCECPETVDCDTALEPSDDWKARINTMVNFDLSRQGAGRPGCVYKMPNTPVPPLSDEVPDHLDCSKFIRGNFLCFASKGDNKSSKAERKAVSDACTLVLVDITAACDHANKKDHWRRFVVGCMVPSRHEDHIWKFKDQGTQTERDVGKPSSDNLLVTPRLRHPGQEGDVYRLVINANLPIPLPRGRLDELANRQVGRIRESLLTDLAQRISFHSARPGHISMS